MKVPLVREGWGIEADETSSQFASRAYAVRFAFQSGSPGYVGDLYVLVGDSFGDGPVLLRRDSHGALLPVDR